MDLVFSAGPLAGAVLATYVFCVRPMRRGHCALTPQARDRDEELRQLRAEVEQLKREMSQA
jgi:hypothetical protein